ncbi:DNA recombination and repair protein Rad51-like C-terminal domain-containing protein [Entamoeba marina]
MPLNDPLLKHYFDDNVLELFNFLKLNTLEQFLTKNPAYFERYVADVHQIEQLQAKLCQQFMGKSYTLLDWKEVVKVQTYSSSIPIIDETLGTNGFEIGKFYDIVGNINGSFYRVIYVIACSFIKNHHLKVLWIDTSSTFDINAFFNTFYSDFDCEELEIETLFENMFLYQCHSLFKLERIIKDISKEERKYDVIIINSLLSFLQGAFFTKSSMYEKTVRFLTRLNKIAHSKRIIIINISPQEQKTKRITNHIVPSCLGDDYYNFPSVQLQISTLDNEVCAYLVKPFLYYTQV